MAEAKGENSWDRVARWAGMGNNKSVDVDYRSEDAMQQDEMTGVDSPEGLDTETISPEAATAETAALFTELERVKAEREQLFDRLARLQAEFDNARKRAEKERSDAREYAVGATIEPFLSVMDNFQLALKSQGSAEQLRSGVELILKQMEEALRGLNVQPVETVGAMFDPRIHEALGSIETAEFPDHQVLEEIRRGYKLREKLLRPAMVRIAANKAVVSD
jgi:molecular chaperone GrpE